MVQGVLVFLADWLPLTAFFASVGVLLWRYFDPYDRKYDVPLSHVFLPGVVLLGVLVMLHLLITLLLPMRWPAIRDEFKRRLGERLQTELETTYGAVPGEVAAALEEERKNVEKIVAETEEVASWLQEREQAASITGLYGK